MSASDPGNGVTYLSPLAERQFTDYFTSVQTVRMPIVARVVGVLLVAAIIIISCFLYFVPWIQTTSGFGTVTALDPRDRQQEINALVSGRIQQWFVQDGSKVKANDPILQIVDNDPQLVERLTAERAALEQSYQAARRATETAQLDFERKKRLYDQGLASRVEFENARIRLEDLRAREAEAQAALTRADVNISRQSIQIVRAPRDGTIVQVTAGDIATFIREGQAVATFVPDGVERAVELLIDGRDISLVVPGRKVRLQFEGWPAVQFSGWPSIAIGTFGGQVVFVDPSAGTNGRFRVLVAPDLEDPQPWPEERFVRFGAQARGWILLDEVSVGYELWRQMNNFPPNFETTATQEASNASP